VPALRKERPRRVDRSSEYFSEDGRLFAEFQLVAPNAADFEEVID
jgi:hypothetical protein